MKTTDLNIKILEPSKPENWLTNGETFSQKVYLGKNDSEANWYEITNAEKEQAERAQPEQGGDDI